jgi:hypothetical protein
MFGGDSSPLERLTAALRRTTSQVRLAGHHGRTICPPAADLFDRLLLPLPNFGSCAAGGIYFVFENAATGAQRNLLGIGLKK